MKQAKTNELTITKAMSHKIVTHKLLIYFKILISEVVKANTSFKDRKSTN